MSEQPPLPLPLLLLLLLEAEAWAEEPDCWEQRPHVAAQ